MPSAHELLMRCFTPGEINLWLTLAGGRLHFCFATRCPPGLHSQQIRAAVCLAGAREPPEARAHALHRRERGRAAGALPRPRRVRVQAGAALHHRAAPGEEGTRQFCPAGLGEGRRDRAHPLFARGAAFCDSLLIFFHYPFDSEVMSHSDTYL